MVDRLLVWLGAGSVCAGVTAAMLAGAGAAFADTDGEGDHSAKTSQSANPGESKQDSGTKNKDAPRQKRGHGVGRTDAKSKGGDKDTATKGGDKDTATKSGDKDNATKGGDKDDATGAGTAETAKDDATGADATEATAKDDAAEDDATESVSKPAKPTTAKRTATPIDDVVATFTHLPDRKAIGELTRRIDPVTVVKPDPITPKPADPPASEELSPDLRLVKTVGESAALTPASPMAAQPKATAARRIDVPPVISAIGTLAFGLISLAESIFEGPPMALPGSGVTVKRSTLVIADQEVPADWYFPKGSLDEGGTPPEHVIYLQHGFLARGVFYDYTASYLAQQTNSVVVAPTLTSNIFATDGMWLGGTQMHQAVADLFTDPANDELLNSAKAAGYTRDQLPQDVVLVGHSLGGGLVIDTARYIAAADGPTPYRLAGVLMLDGVSFTDPVPILRDIPDSIPVYNLSATPYMWNLFGTMDHALAQVRGDQFHGAQLLGGLHSDAMIGGNPLIQFGAYLLTGFSLPSNVAGSQILAAGWINDMFAGTQTCNNITCFYGQPGDRLTIPTPAGPATALVEPQPDAATVFARELTAFFIGLLGHINFATDVPAGQEANLDTEVAA